jgi:hypothetical protein
MSPGVECTAVLFAIMLERPLDGINLLTASCNVGIQRDLFILVEIQLDLANLGDVMSWSPGEAPRADQRHLQRSLRSHASEFAVDQKTTIRPLVARLPAAMLFNWLLILSFSIFFFRLKRCSSACWLSVCPASVNAGSHCKSPSAFYAIGM